MRKASHSIAVITLVALLFCFMNPSALAYTTGDDYPAKYKTPDKDAVVDEWNFYNRECTSFAAWCLNSRNGVGFHNWLGGIQWGHAKTWDDAASRLGYAVDQNPAVGAIAFWQDGRGGSSSAYGHVAWVREVNGSQVTVEEYNWSISGGFGQRTFDKSAPSGYIHIHDIISSCELDVNGWTDNAENGNVANYATFDVYINGSLAADDVSDFCTSYKPGTAYEIRDIKVADGKAFDGYSSYTRSGYASGGRTGTLNANTDVRLTLHTVDAAAFTRNHAPAAVSVYNGHTYYFYDTPATWYGAKIVSEHLGGHLVTVTSAGENSFVKSMIGDSACWLGGTDKDSEGTWTWVTGEAFSYSNWYGSAYGGTEPNNDAASLEGQENYAHIRAGSDTWNDNAGCTAYPFICEIDKAYTVSYSANGGTGAPASQTKAHGIALTLSSAVPSHGEGYDFLGWATSSSATAAAYQPGGQYTLNASKKLFAVWKVKTCTITFDPNGGTVSPIAKTVSYGSAYGDLPTPTKAGYAFDGWYTAAEGGAKVTSATVLTETTDQTVFAHWSPMGELTLPNAVQTIDGEAFMGDSHISRAVIPESCASVGSKAFANCVNLISVRFLGKNTTFESDTFEGSPNVVIYCPGGSRAQRLASADGLEYHLIGVASDWVPADDVPSGAEITDRKWTYTLREYTESASSSYVGWTRYDSKRTSWGPWSEWKNEEISENSDRQVETRTVITGYTMISYCVSGPNGRSYQPSPTYSVRLQHGPYWWSKEEFDSARVFPAGSYFDYASNVAGYVLDATGYCKWDGSDTGGYVPMFIQSTATETQWRGRNAVYTYYYYRDVNKESAQDPSGQDNVSNVQEWVQYVY